MLPINKVYSKLDNELRKLETFYKNIFLKG